MPILVTITGRDPAAGETLLRWSTGAGYVSPSGSTPAHAVWEPRLIQPGNFERSIFRPGQSFGSSQVGYGEVLVNNADGELDPLLGWAFDGRAIEIRRGPRAGVYPDDYPLVLRGTLAGVEFQRRQLVFRLRDRRAEIADQLLVTETYAGTNALPAGLEGTPNDLQGAYKPQPFGAVRNASLPIVNTSQVTAQVAARATQAIALSAAYDRGSLRAAEADYGSIADLTQAANPTAGKRRFYPGAASAGAYVRFGGGTLDGAPTADIVEGATTRDRYAARVMARMLAAVGVSAADVIGVERLDGVVPWVVGHWTGTEAARAGDALDRIAASFHGYWVPDRLGRIVIDRLEAPAGPPVAVLEPWCILDSGNALSRLVDAGEGIPARRVVVNGQRNWTVQSADTLAGIALDERAWRSREYRTASVDLPSVRAIHPLSEDLEVDTALDSLADMASLAALLAELYGVRRDVYEVGVPGEIALPIDLGDAVELRVPRFDLSAGKLLRVIAVVEDLARNRSTLTLWG